MYDTIIFLAFLFVGFMAGTIAEQSHFKSLKKREKKMVSLPAVTIKNALEQGAEVDKVYLVSGSCVVSLDYFKRVLAGLKNIVGGRIGAYETLVDRGRREAILRMKEAAKKAGSDIIVNMRLETSAIGQSANQKNSLGSIEVIAYGTAIVLKK